MTTGIQQDTKTQTIINEVCAVCGITPQDLKKRTRAEPIPTARALIAHFLYREIRMTPRDIFLLIGAPGYNRTAIYHYIGRKTLIETRSPFQKELKIKTEQIKQRLQLK